MEYYDKIHVEQTEEAQKFMNELQQYHQQIQKVSKDISPNDKQNFWELFSSNDSFENKFSTLSQLDPFTLGYKAVYELAQTWYKESKSSEISPKIKSALAREKLTDYYGIFGTGGDVISDSGEKINTINISTIAALLAASVKNEDKETYCPILKVGSMAVTSVIGSANLFKHIFGVRSHEHVVKDIIDTGFSFLSPGDIGIDYNHNLKLARKAVFESGITDVIKIVGPTACLMDPKGQVTGVSSTEMLPFVLYNYNESIESDRLDRAIVIYSETGVDELVNGTYLFDMSKEQINLTYFHPSQFGLEPIKLDKLKEKASIEEQAQYTSKILSNDDSIDTEVINVLCLNAATILCLKTNISNLHAEYLKLKHLFDADKTINNLKISEAT